MSLFIYTRALPDYSSDLQIRLVQQRFAPTDAEQAEVFTDVTSERDAPWFERLGGKALRERLQPGDTVVVASGSAIWSGAAHAVRIADEMATRGTTLIILKEGFTFGPDSPELAVFRAVVGTMSLLSQSNRSEAIRLGIEEKRRRGGRHCHHPGYGKRWVGEKGREVLVEDEDEMRVVAKIQEWRSKRFSVESIFCHLREHGIRTRAGVFWSRDRIRRASLTPINLARQVVVSQF